MSSVRLAALAAFVGCASLWAVAAHAQVFRVVGPDGKVTFTDRPPAESKAEPAAVVSMAGGGGSSSASLPMVLRSVVSRFPVTLYTSPECGPCAAARSYLTTRGVPYTERTITTNEDIKALSGLAGEPRVPFATIGGQHVNGFSDQEYGSYLDAAGYPKASQLPATWRNPAPAPLVAVQAPQAAANRPAPQRAPQPRAEAPVPSAPSPANPAGIRF
ncbi:MAG: DUF4124 domain-containing protein [Comamonadaceae bacterium]|nr:MAG: DUF4124 domain-containing protein [Comamonadaceae bacterium]